MYPVPPSLLFQRSLCSLVPFSLVVCGSIMLSFLEWGVGGVFLLEGEGGKGLLS